MAATRKKRSEADGGSEVAELLRRLDHPLKAEIAAVRAVILGASPEIREGVKWNAPSFRVEEWFATIHLRNREAVQLILHLGAKVRDGGTAGLRIEDPDGLLEWLSGERATIRLRDQREIRERSKALAAIVRQWIAYLR